MSNQLKTNFLYAAIADAQSTIRATDSKIGVLLVILAIPLTKLGNIYARCHELLSNKNQCLAELAAVLIFIFACLWVLSFCAAIKAIIGIDNPSRHIDGAKPTGIFYSAHLFNPTFGDVFFNRPILSKKQLEHQLKELPESLEDVEKELAFEHAKLVYIRAIKINRMKCAFACGFGWVFLGGALWLMNLFFRMS